MTLPISSTQLDLAARMVTDSVWLFVLTTYSDKAAGTVSDTFYWTHTGSALSYDYEGSGDVQFLPLVVNKPGSTLGASVPRIADGSASDRQALLVTLDNSPVQDASGNILHDAIWETLIGENLHGADLVVSELLVNPHLRVNASTPWWDLRSLAGTDHTVRFRGECVQVEPVGSTVPMRFAHVEPEVPFVTLLDQQNNHPEDFGSRLPVIVGQAKGVECKRIKVGALTVLSSFLNASTTGSLKVTNAQLFPVASQFFVWLDGEEIECDGSDADANTINIVTRGVNNTSATGHLAGAVMVELVDETILGVSGSVCSEVETVEIFNPFSGEWTEVATPYEVRLVDVEAIPGEVITTVRLSQDSLRELLGAFFRSAQVTVQPEFDGDSGGTSATFSTFQFEPSSWVIETDSSAPDNQNWDDSTGRPRVGFLASQRETLKGTFQSGDFGAHGSKVVKKWRLRIEADSISGPISHSVYVATVSGLKKLGGLSARAGIDNGSGSGTSKWVDINDGTTVSDLTDGILKVYIAFSGFIQSHITEVDFFGVEAQVYTAGGPSAGSGGVQVSRTVDSEIEAASQSFNARFRADAKGATVPGTFSDAYTFNEGTSWNTLDATQSDQSGFQRVALNANVQVHDCNALDTFTAVNGATRTLETTIKNEGTGSIKVVANTVDDELRMPDWSASTHGAALDLSEHFLAFDLFVEDNAATEIQNAAIYLGTGANFAAPWSGWRLTDFLPTDFALGEWHSVVMDATKAGRIFGSGTLTTSSIKTWAMIANVDTSPLGGTSKAMTFYVDDFRLVEKEGVVQRNASSATNWTSPGDAYAVVLTGTNVDRLETLKIQFEDTAGTGTTLPAAYRELTFSGGQMTEGVEVEITPSVQDVGGPAYTNVETIRLQMNHNGSGPEVPSIDIKTLRLADASNANYTLAPGTLIENPADVDRWFIADFCGLGHAAVGSTNSSFKTALSILGKIGGNLTGLGERFAEIRGKYLFESRASGYEIETASGTVYQVRHASLAHTWGLVDETLAKTDYESVTEELPDVTELGSSFQAFWAYTPTLGFGESAFQMVSVTNPSESDAIVTLGDAAAMAAARARFGLRRHPPFFFVMIQDANAAADTMGFYAYVRSEEKFGTYRLEGVPNWKAFALEPGDIVSIALRGTSRTVSKAEVLSCQRAPGSMVATLVCGGVE